MNIRFSCTVHVIFRRTDNQVSKTDNIRLYSVHGIWYERTYKPWYLKVIQMERILFNTPFPEKPRRLWISDVVESPSSSFLRFNLDVDVIFRFVDFILRLSSKAAVSEGSVIHWWGRTVQNNFAINEVLNGPNTY